MANKQEEDEYWESSRIKALSFEDEDDSNGTSGRNRQFERLSHRVRADLQDENSLFSERYQPQLEAEIPLYNLISDEALNNILSVQCGESPSFTTVLPSEELSMLRRQVRDMYEPQQPTYILRNLLLGRPLLLENFRSLKCKTDLLDTALALGDGDGIIMSVLWLQKTLRRKFFHQILRDRPFAVQHYVNYLSIHNKSSELSDLLAMLGKSNEAAILHLQIIIRQPVEIRLAKLKTYYANHVAQPGIDPHFSSLVNRYISLLEWQNLTVSDPSSPVMGSSAIRCLHWACQTHWSSSGPVGPRIFSEVQKIAPMQFEWTAIFARCAKEGWNDVEGLVTKKGLFKNLQISTQVPLDKIILHLHSSSAPADMLERLMTLLTEPKKSNVIRLMNSI